MAPIMIDALAETLATLPAVEPCKSLEVSNIVPKTDLIRSFVGFFSFLVDLFSPVLIFSLILFLQ